MKRLGHSILLGAEEPLAMDRLLNFSSPVLFGVRDPVRFMELMDEAKNLVSPGFYLGDNFFAWSRNLSMFEDSVFKRAWESNVISEDDHSKPWGRYIEACAAVHSAKLDGDFVFFGLGSGSSIATIIDYLGDNCAGHLFWAFGSCSEHAKRVALNNSRIKLINEASINSLKENIPPRIAYLQINLEDASLLLDVLTTAFNKVVFGGVILVCNYEMAEHWRNHKALLDPWLRAKGYIAIPLPTGHGMVFKAH